MFTAGGLVQTSDTGQINLSTVLFPTSTNTFSGYQMFRFNDALQSTLPIFLKINYYRGGTGNAIRLDITTGTVTNGAGTLSGQLSTLQSVSIAGSVTVQTCYTSGDGSRFATAWGLPYVSSGSAGVFILIERLRDANGANTADGFFLLCNQGSTLSGGSAMTSHEVVPASGVIIQTNGLIPCWPWMGSSLSTGGNLYMTALSPFSNQLHNPCTGLMKYWLTDMTLGAEFALTTYSTAMNFKALGALGPSSFGFATAMIGTVSNGASYGFAIRWE